MPLNLFDSLSRQLATVWKPHRTQPLAPRNYRCACGQAVFFRNTACLACGGALGFEPEGGRMHRLQPGVNPGEWLAPGLGRVRRCANLAACGCNWLVSVEDARRCHGLCRACRLNRTVPDLSQPDNVAAWAQLEVAKRRLVSQLIALGLPVRSRLSEDPAQGLMFDLLRPSPGAAPVLTGHAQGLITVNVDEADDARREQIRTQLHEPYRTLLGHFRHEVGHYYWDRLVAGSAWLGPFRARFGDERASYADALQRHYQQGPAPDWAQRCVSAYASTHPWEDWAETWAHYLHMVDTLDTALSFGLEGDDVDMDIDRYSRDALDDPQDPDGDRFLGVVNAWLELTTLLNELARAMGQPDLVPFVLSRPAVAKLHLVHRIVTRAREA